MKSLLSVMLVCALAVGSMDADARRLGGGKSVGKQSSNVTQREATPTAPATPGAPAQSNVSNAAAVAGLGLAWLANSLGLGAAFGNILLIALLVLAAVVVWRIFAARSRANGAQRSGGLAFQGAGGPANPASPVQYSPNNVGNDASARPWERQGAAFDSSATAQHGSAALSGGSMIGSALSGAQSWGIPAGFDVDGFLAAAKRNFVTLQDAWDHSDMSALRSMLTDEMLQEIRGQMAGREPMLPGQ